MRLEIVAEKITDLLEKRSLIESDQAAVYVYGMTLMISSTATLLATLLLGFVFHVIDCLPIKLDSNSDVRNYYVQVDVFTGSVLEIACDLN